MTQILGVSFIFIVVSIVAIVNFIRINLYLNKEEKNKSKEEKHLTKRKNTNIYDIKTRKK